MIPVIRTAVVVDLRGDPFSSPTPSMTAWCALAGLPDGTVVRLLVDRFSHCDGQLLATVAEAAANVTSIDVESENADDAQRFAEKLRRIAERCAA